MISEIHTCSYLDRKVTESRVLFAGKVSYNCIIDIIFTN